MYHGTCNSSWSFCCQALSTAQALISLKLLLINLGLINPGFLKIDFSPQDSRQRWWCFCQKSSQQKRRVWSEQISLTQINHQLSLFCGVVVDVYFYSSFGDHGFGLMIQLVVSHYRLLQSGGEEAHLSFTMSLGDTLTWIFIRYHFSEEVIEVLFLLCLNTAILMIFYIKPQGDYYSDPHPTEKLTCYYNTAQEFLTSLQPLQNNATQTQSHLPDTCHQYILKHDMHGQPIYIQN